MACAAPARAQLIQQYLPEGFGGYGNGPGVTVLTRSQTEVGRPGVQVGSFVIRPLLSQGAGYNSNVLAATNGKGSSELDTQASVGVNSNWSRNGVSAFASVDDANYLQLPALSAVSWNAGLNGYYQIGRDTIYLGGSHSTSEETGNTINSLVTDTPVQVDNNDFYASYSTTFGRLSVTPTLDYSTARYGGSTLNGQPISLNSQDVNLTQGSVNFGYELAPEQNAVVVTRVVSAQYVVPIKGQPSPNSLSYEILGGFESGADAVVRYRALFGFEDRTFNSPQYKPHAAPVIEAGVVWTPSGLTTVTGTAQREIEDAAAEGQQGFEYTSVKLEVDHEYLRDVLLVGYIQFENADYLGGTSGNSKQYDIGGSVRFRLNRNLTLVASDTFFDRNSNSFGNANVNVAMLRLEFGL